MIFFKVLCKTALLFILFFKVLYEKSCQLLPSLSTLHITLEYEPSFDLIYDYKSKNIFT